MSDNYQLISTFVRNNNLSKLHSSRYSVDDYDLLTTKILNSEFWKYLPRPPILIQETDGYDQDIPLIFMDNYNNNKNGINTNKETNSDDKGTITILCSFR